MLIGKGEERIQSVRKDLFTRKQKKPLPHRMETRAFYFT